MYRPYAGFINLTMCVNHAHVNVHVSNLTDPDLPRIIVVDRAGPVSETTSCSGPSASGR